MPSSPPSRPRTQTVTPAFVEAGGALADLRLALATEGEAPLLLYVVRSARVGDDRITHHGSGPNLEGGVGTLCTCKHHVRTWRSVAAGTWVAGVTSGARGSDVRQALFYLARIERTFANHRELWASLPDAARRAKSMSENYLGDVFAPLPAAATDPYAATSYRPVRYHSHVTEAGDATALDRDRCDVPGVRPRLVAFDPAATFAWQRPLIRREADHSNRIDGKSGLNLNDVRHRATIDRKPALAARKPPGSLLLCGLGAGPPLRRNTGSSSSFLGSLAWCLDVSEIPCFGPGESSNPD